VCLTSLAAEMALDEGRCGILLSCSFWGVVAGLLVAGPMADRTGFRLLLVAGALLEAAGMFLTAAAPDFLNACGGACVMGLGVGVTDALATPVVCSLYPERRTEATNLLHAFFPAGLLFIIAGALLFLDTAIGWRRAYRVTGMLCFPAAAAFALLRMPRKTHAGEQRVRTRTLLGSPVFLLMGAVIFLAGASELGPAQWLPAFVERAAQDSQGAGAWGRALTRLAGGPKKVGILGLSLYAGAMLAGRAAASRLAARVRPTTVLAGGAFLVGLGLALAAASPNVLASILFLAASGLGVSCLWPTTLAIAGDRFPSGGATMFAILPVLGNTGGLLSPMVIGFVAKATSLRLGMGILAVAPALCLIAVWLLRAPERRW
jgi:MFS family permease